MSINLRFLIPVILFFILTHPLYGQKSYQNFYSISIENYKKGDYASFLEAAKIADSLRPNHPTLMYNLAAGYALTSQTEKAIHVLSDRISFYASDDFYEDSDFNSMTNETGYRELQQMLDRLNTPRMTSVHAFSVEGEDNLHAEGITYHEPSSRFYIGDIRSGKIFSYKSDGSDRQQMIDLSEHGYWSVMGMSVDASNPELLWVTTSALPEFEQYKTALEGKSAVLLINTVRGTVEETYKIEGQHTFGDIISGKDGRVFISDSKEPKIDIVEPEDSLRVLVEDERWWNLQGLTLSADGRYLYIADYITGIFKVDLVTLHSAPLLKSNAITRGADGIYLRDNRLIFIQNGTTPKRVGIVTIDDEGNGIEGTLAFPDQALDALNEPTLGTFAGQDFYYIANSPWAYYDKERNPLLENWPKMQVWKLKLQ